MRAGPRRLLLAAILLAGVIGAFADGVDPPDSVEAIMGKTRNGYVHAILDNGTLRPETYRFAKGEFWGGDLADPSIDRMTVDDIARAITPSLARRSYYAVRPGDEPKFVIVINWGTTSAPEHRAMSMAVRRNEDAQMQAHGGSTVIAGDTAVMDGVIGGFQRAELGGGVNSNALGSSDPAIQGENAAWEATAIENAKMLGYPTSLEPELLRYRYFVVLLAYDSRTTSDKKPRLLWEARLSISEHHNFFNEALPALAANASDLFGRDSDGLIRRPLARGHVIIGQLRSLEFPSESDFAAISSDGVYVAFLATKDGVAGVSVADLEGLKGGLFAALPHATPTARVQWADSRHPRVTLASGRELTLDLGSRRWSSQASAMQPRPAASPAQTARVESELQAKFEDRAITVLGADSAGAHWLAAVSRGPVTRYYVYDRANDLLIEAGMTGRAQ
jgi:hypothetical protein